ncbi:hypothetical protein CEE37_08520 [candidate division LCP-89 bacterium B3_LCP]|uniref:Uncharacterized protein n=1 Tax=candidate division LCP-89 bacterium B3_LCP TaxID=2012998 RepID=A0A532UZI2_UNCL8|nr:MAG: hypothetical protein CEE37_08520 [candidate division LCP-89 bacterium B3_LCP]
MDEKETTGIRPVSERGEGWHNRQQKKQKVEGSQDDSNIPHDKSVRQSAPLPFGKLDLLA